MSEKKPEKMVLDPEGVARLLQEAVKTAISEAKSGSAGEFELAKEPFQRKTKVEEDAKKYGSLISRPKSTADAKKELVGFKTGTFIDQLFLNEKNEPLGGIPIVSQLGIVGNPEVGKSILIQEIALRCASEGKKVVFITSEDTWQSPSPRFDLQARFRQKAEIMGLDWETIQHNLFVLDSTFYTELREWQTLVETYRYLVEILKGIDLLIIDSLTLLESYRGAIKYRVIEMARYNQRNGITAIYVSQRASEEDADKLGYAGGVGIGHNLDGTICIDFKKAISELKEDLNRNRPKDNQVKQWDLVHFVRALGCRLCGVDRKYYEITITSNGLLRLKNQLIN